MKAKQIAIMLIGVSLMVPSLQTCAEVVIHRTEEEVISVVSQKLSIAKSEKDVEALQAAKGMMFSSSTKGDKTTFHHLTSEASLKLRLQILQVDDNMQDKSYDHTIRPRAGRYGSVPWPPENERPEALRNARLWYPRTPPEYYREKDPELYAFYKPLFEENRKNTEKHTRETRIREVRRGLLNSIKWYLEIECDRGAESRDFGSYLRLVDEIIEDKQLRDEILSDIPPERRLPVSPSEEKTAP